MHKTSTIIRIVTWSIVLVVCLSVFQGLFRWRMFGGWPIVHWNWGQNFNWSQNVDWGSGEQTTIQDKTFAADSIGRLDISWTSGDVTVYKSSDSNIRVVQKEREGFPQKQYATIAQEGDKLVVKDYEMRWSTGLTLIGRRSALEIYLPEKQWNSMQVNSVSANVQLEYVSVGNLSCELVSGRLDINHVITDTMKINQVSGTITGNDITAGKLQMETISGGCDLSGSMQQLDLNTVSGNVSVATQTMPTFVKAEMISGSTTLRIPENDGFTVDLDRVSGNFKSNSFPTVKDGQRYTYKNGGANFSAELVSGSFTVEKY